MRTPARSGFAALLLLLTAAIGFEAGGCGNRSRDVEDPGGAVGVHAVYRELAGLTLWPGFAPAGTPLAIYDGTDTWLFDHPAPPAEFDSIAPSTRKRVGRAPEVTANSSVRLGGVETATLKLGRVPAADSVAPLAATAIHETFHVFERARHPNWVPNEVSLFAYPSEQDTLVALGELEIEALARAASHEDVVVAAAWARTALDLRRQRFARLDAESMAYERNGEKNEGLAQYVEHRALRLRRGGDAMDLVAQRPGRPAILARPRFDPDGVRWRVYATGEAWAVLLDRFAPSWADSMQAGDDRALDRRLAAQLAQPGAPDPSRRVQFEPQEVTAAHTAAVEAVAALRSRRANARRDLETAPGDGLRITVLTGEPLWPQGFDPLNVDVLGEGSVLHRRWLKLGNGAGTVEILDRHAITTPAGAHPLFNGVQSVALRGFPSPLEASQAGDTLVIVAKGASVRLRGAQVTRSGDWTEIRLGGKP